MRGRRILADWSRLLRSRLEVEHGRGNAESLGLVHWVHPEDGHPAAVAINAEIIAEEAHLAQVIGLGVELVVDESPAAVDAAGQGQIGVRARLCATIVVFDVYRSIHRIHGQPWKPLLLGLVVTVDAQRLRPGLAAVARDNQKYVGIAVARVGP